MALNPADANNIDPELKDFIVNAQIKAQIQAQIKKLNIVCFEKCVEKPGSKLESKQETCSDDDQTFHLIRLPKETVERARTGGAKAGTVYVLENNNVEFHDTNTNKVYKLIRNDPTSAEARPTGSGGYGGSQQHAKANKLVACEESDLFKISIQKEEAVHLGKVKLSTLLAVPKDGARGVSVVAE